MNNLQNSYLNEVSNQEDNYGLNSLQICIYLI